MLKTIAPASVGFAASVVFRRERANMTRKELARRAGISRYTLHSIENTRANIHLGTIVKLARALETDPCTFFSAAPHSAPSEDRLHDIQRAVAYNIRTARLERSISQNDLNRAAGFPSGYLGVIERTAPDITLEMVERISTCLGIPLVALLRPRATTSNYDQRTG